MSSLTPFCARCGGKMYRIRDLFGEYDDCINCGYHRDIFEKEGPPIELKPAWIPKTKVIQNPGPSSGRHYHG